MFQNAVLGIMSLALTILTPTGSTNSSQALPQVEEARVHVVKANESLADIAKVEYGDDQFWKTIWIDNDWIENPNNIYNNWKLKIRAEKPQFNPVFKEELDKRYKKEQEAVIINPPAVVTPSLATESAQAQSQLPPTSSPTPVTNSPGPLTVEQITYLGNCESGMTANRNSGNGFYGAFQFALGTWSNMQTGYARADQAPIEVQIDAVQKLVARSNIYGQFPECSQRMHSDGVL